MRFQWPLTDLLPARSAIRRFSHVFIVFALLTATNAGFDVPEAADLRPGPETVWAEGLGVRPVLETYFAGGEMPAVQGWARFVKEHGEGWDLVVDARSGLPNLVSGQGIPWYPGAGNDLAWDKEAGTEGPTMGLLEDLAREFLRERRDLMQVNEKDLVLEAGASRLAGPAGDHGTVVFGYAPGGVPVEGARVYFRVNSGNLVQFGAVLVAPVRGGVKPQLGEEEALGVVREHHGAAEGVQPGMEEPGRLVRVPHAEGETGYGHWLVWDLKVRWPGEEETWEALVDAETGELRKYVGVSPRGLVDAAALVEALVATKG